MKRTYIVLTGAKKNAGDYLITEKCKELITKFKPEFELIQIERWEKLDDKLDIVNASKGIILMGGPAFTSQMYPDVYRLVDDLEKIKVPIIPMAVGWNSYPGDFESMLNFRFSSKSMKLLKKISSSSKYISVRDFYTNSILRRHGIENSLMTGCASWYNLDSIGKKMNLFNKPKVVAFTPAQDVRYSNITIETMKRVKEIFSDSKIICAFHRGIGMEDEHTSKNDAMNTRRIASIAKNLEMEIADLSFSYENYKKYDNIDFHIGFRLHAHLYFMSKRNPSLLIHEDGRGKSMSETLGIHGIDAFKTYPFNKQLNIANKILGKLSSPLIFKHDVRKDVPNIVEHMLLSHIETGFSGYAGVSNTIDSYFEVMKNFVMSLPE
jgi:hypothetical protein